MAKEVVTETKPTRVSAVNINHSWLYGLVGILILLVVFMAGVGAANHHNRMVRPSGAMAGGFSKRIFGGERGFRADGGQLSNVGNSTRGVVTAVNGASFTLAGNGATTNVTTNSSTQYQDGNTVKQNDTVIVFGTTTNNTLTATQVIINP
jgi:hypothetical protein